MLQGIRVLELDRTVLAANARAIPGDPGAAMLKIQRLEAAAPIDTLPEALNEPRNRALGMIQDGPGEDDRPTGSAVSFDGVRPAIRDAAPRPGGGTAAAPPSVRGV